jgi:hypothetical protein
LKIFRKPFNAAPINADYKNMQGQLLRPDISLEVLKKRFLLDVIYISDETDLRWHYNHKKEKYK